MWKYKNITREQFEKVKDRVEELLIECGAEKADIELPYEQKTTAYVDDNGTEHTSCRSVYRYGDLYYRIDQICFPEIPFIVFECGSLDELLRNIMEDTDPFPYNLSDGELRLEIDAALSLSGHPEENKED